LRIILLQTLVIKNFTLVEHLEVDFNNGMTALTGETGAGKSLVVDALAMALGDRADTNQVRRAADKCEISAIFDIRQVSLAKSWLKAHDFDNQENDCVIRRMLTKDGRSRGYINGQSATMQQLREIGETLIDIHNQHEHQSLLRRETHRLILDNFANCNELSINIKRFHQEWIRAKKELEKLKNTNIGLISSKDFLSFQLQELNEINISEGELQSLEEEQICLANSESIISDCNRMLQLYSEAEECNLEKLLNESIQILQKIPAKSESLEEAHRSLVSAQIEIQESGREIQQYLNNFNSDPEALHKIENKLTEIYHLARKYKISPENLYSKKKSIESELKKLSVSHDEESRLNQQIKKLFAEYSLAAKKLSEIRTKASIKISSDIEKQLKLLSMTGAQFNVNLEPIKNNDLGGRGQEEVEFLISTNPGEPCKPLARIASGGELSRISLAIQAIAAKNSSIPTLVFDEVDVGIGGATADIVGSILRDLGGLGQILCITHQPQVASKAHNHMRVSKNTIENLTFSNIVTLNDSEKLNEIARMLGGIDITEATLDHAKEMLSSNEKN
jgi:DNA repair protein RecN (Recombination protein N)